MDPTRRISTAFSSAITSDRLRDLRRGAAEWSRRLRRAPHRVEYFHQVDDPYSHLAAQTLARLQERYEIALQPYLVGPPSAEAAPERDRLAAFARKDAGDIAAPYGLGFPKDAAAPSAATVRKVVADLASTPVDRFARRAVTLGTALWHGKDAEIDRIATATPRGDIDAVLAAGEARRRKLGHYLGAMFHYAGEWYWGVDRLHYLEERLRALGAARAASPAEPIVMPPPPPGVAGAGDRPGVTVEFFLSLRSPYTHIAMQRTFDLARRYPIELRLRPVLPMVMRGLPVPLAKRLYIVRDTKREADRAGVAFGRICDPVGEPVEKGFALYDWARRQGRAAEFLHAFTTAAFAEGIDTGSAAGMRHVVESAGLDWQEALAHREDRAWRQELEANREHLFGLGLWGVPSFTVTGGGRADFCTWGQDRLWLVEREIAARLAPS